MRDDSPRAPRDAVDRMAVALVALFIVSTLVLHLTIAVIAGRLLYIAGH
jgi:hypothetical protein